MVKITSSLFSLTGFAETRQGGRPENQDDFAFSDTPLGFLVVVCDGMGGGPGGKTASSVAKAEIVRSLMHATPQMSISEALCQAAAAADSALKAYIARDQRLAGMGSTFVAILIRQSSAIIAHAGDSRCYRLHRGRMVFRTHDHSLVGELVRKRSLTEEQARTSPQSNLITRGLGSVSNTQPDVDIVPYCQGDRFVLCTDGVWGIMEQSQLLSRFREMKNLSTDVLRMADEIDRIGFGQGGHHDNHTFVVIDMEANSTLKDSLSLRLLQPRMLMIASALALLLFIGVGSIAWLCSPSKSSTFVGGGGYTPTSVEPSRQSQLFTPQDPAMPVDSGNASSTTDTLHSASKPDTARQRPAPSLPDNHRLHDAQLLEEIRHKVNQLHDIRYKKEKDATKRSEQLVDEILSQLNDLRNECELLKNDSISTEAQNAHKLAKSHEKHLKAVRLVNGFYVIIEKGRSVAERLQRKLDKIAELRKSQSH
uniref:PP2C family protein-serine/threonine phosphatase n=1 Tax=Alloprevotella sp. TaxID=1872471 RepID=UPI00402742E9